MDWATIFPYALIASILLIAIGIYALITSKSFIRIVFGIELILLSAIIILLSFGATEVGVYTPDSMTQTFAITIMIIGAAFAVVGTSLEKQFRKTTDTPEIDFNFSTSEADLKEEKEAVNLGGSENE